MLDHNDTKHLPPLPWQTSWPRCSACGMPSGSASCPQTPQVRGTGVAGGLLDCRVPVLHVSVAGSMRRASA